MGGARQQRFRTILFLLIGLGTTGLVLLSWGFGVLDSFERDSIDARFSIRGAREPPAQVVVVAIDDVTTNDLDKTVWPYPRRLHAGVLDSIAADHPRAIAVDIQFTEQTTQLDDNTLLDAVANAKNVVLATTETLPNGETRIFGGNEVVREVGARPASGLLPTDSAGVIRKIPYSVNGLKTLAVVTVERATGRKIGSGGFGKHGAWIDYAGPANTFTTYSYSQLLPPRLFRAYSSASHAVPARLPRGTFTDKIVVIGPAAPSLQDIHATPFDPLMPGVEVQANATATVLRGLPLRSEPLALSIALILVLGFLAPAIASNARPRVSLPAAVLAAALFVVAVQLSFNHGRIVLFVYPLAALTLSAVGSLGVATQGIRGGANRRVLDQIKATGDIFIAWSDEDWVIEGAAVHVSFVGYDDGSEETRMLNGQAVTEINANLTAGTDLTKVPRLKDNLGVAFMGDTKGGAFDIPAQTAQKMLGSPNPHGRSNSEVVRPWVNSLDVMRRPRDVWIIDFGVDKPQAEAALYEAPFEYVKEHVMPVRATNRRLAYAERWWLHVEPRQGMRKALKGLSRFLVTPTVSKHRVFAWLDGETLPDHQLIAFARDDDYFFGVLHSVVHELWARGLGTQLREVESGFRYTPTTTFETFPFPADGDGEEEVAAAARNIDTLRAGWLNPDGASEEELRKRTLTNLYNQRPTWLAQAHERLDRAVHAAYEWEYPLEPEDVLARLVELNLSRAATVAAT